MLTTEEQKPELRLYMDYIDASNKQYFRTDYSKMPCLEFVQLGIFKPQEINTRCLISEDKPC